MDIIKTTVPRRGLHLSIVIALTSSLLSFVAPAKASTPTPIYDFRATGYNATTGQWPNTGSLFETVSVSKKNVGTPNPVKDSEPNSVALVGSNEHEFITLGSVFFSRGGYFVWEKIEKPLFLPKSILTFTNVFIMIPGF